jgi:RNA polymerase sigma-70 factor (ECF subfamily)
MNVDALYRELAPKVGRLARRMIANRALAEEAAQEVWTEVLGSWNSFDGRSSMSTWVYTVARRTILRNATREKRYSTRFLDELFEIRADDGMPAWSALPDEARAEWLRQECEDCLTAILHCIPSEDRFLYLLRRVGDLPWREIATVLGEPEAALRQTYSRANRKISAFLRSRCTLYNPAGDCRCKLSAPLKLRPEAWAPVVEASKKIAFVRAADLFHDPGQGLALLREGKDLVSPLP